MSELNKKDVMQEIMDEQSKLDRNIIKQHDLFNESNEVDLTANFGHYRKEGLSTAYSFLKSVVRVMRKMGAKWWKQQEPITEQQLDKSLLEFFNEHPELDIVSNISMKNIAIIQELIELEDAVKEGKPKEEIHDEFVDVLHFVVSLGLDLGINSSEKLRQLYLKKNHVNHQRQQSNY